MRLALILVLLAGCASSHIVTGTKRPPIPVAQVKIYSLPPANFEEIGIIEASSKNALVLTDQDKMDAVVDRLKQEAAALGANGVLIDGTGSESTGGLVNTYRAGKATTGFYTQSTHKTGKALAIYVKD